jgi:hypothetical protein
MAKEDRRRRHFIDPLFESRLFVWRADSTAAGPPTCPMSAAFQIFFRLFRVLH